MSGASLGKIVLVSTFDGQICLLLSDFYERRLFRISAKAYQRTVYSVATKQESEDSLEIRARELSQVYQSYFHLRMFNMCRVDLEFTFSVGFFIASYVVLVTQTI